MSKTELSASGELSSEAKRALLTQLLQKKAEKSAAPLPLSANQQALWFLHQLAPESWAYNVVFTARICSEVNRAALQQAFQYLVDRHPSLRTTYASQNGSPVQRIQPSFPMPLTPVDAAGWSPEQLRDRLKTVARRPFDLENGPVLRVHLFSQTATEHVLLLVVHHIAVDLWSVMVLLDELREAYAAYVAGTIPALPVLAMQYTDYVSKQAQMLNGAAGDRLLAYWQQQLAGDLPILNLPTDHPRPAVQTFNGASQTFQLSPEITQQFKALARAEEVTLYMALLAAFQVLLHRYTHQEEVIVGSPTAGRNWSEFSGVVGDFINPVAMGANLADNPSFKSFLMQVRDTVLGALQHQTYPFSYLVEHLNPAQANSYSPIFQVFFTLQKLQRFEELADFILPSAADTSVEFGGLTLKPYPFPHQEGQFDLSLEMIETSGTLYGSFKYNPDLFEAAAIARLVTHFQTLLGSIVNDPEQAVSALPLLTAEEEQQQLVEWNQTQTHFPQQLGIHQLFEAQVERTPHATAVVFADQALTYQELNQRANQLAHYLHDIGLEPNALVGIFLQQSVELIVGLLGILKAGAAYVPLDPNYPGERLRFMLEDTRVPVLLTQQSLVEKLPSSAARLVCLDSDWEAIGAQTCDHPIPDITPDSLAYVIYTSGSTGRPKGVSVTHRAIARLLFNTDYIHLNPDDNVAQVSNAAFDAATFEIWGALLHGGKLVIIAKDILLSPHDFAAQLKGHEISVLFLTTALFNQLASTDPEAFAGLRYLLFGGEAVDPKWVKEVLKSTPPQNLVHVYGPTENTTFSCGYRIQSVPEVATTIPIGRPIANTQAYVLDAHLQPVPVGVSGELHLGGAGLARGYLNRPELTAEKFIANPFGEGRLYKTGDLVRYLPDGNLEFLGRIDHQVKIRGFRIELGEIESVLSQHDQVQQCVVVVREATPGDKRLVVYSVSPTESRPTSTDLRQFLAQKLPDYMVPSVFISLETLPLTVNGKINRNALPAPDDSILGSGEKFAAPSTPTEESLGTIWSSVLGLQQVGIRDNFFELGGHSLLAVQLFAKIETTFHQHFPISTLFQAPTIEQLAAIIDAQKIHNPDLEGTPSSSPAAKPPLKQPGRSSLALIPLREQGRKPPMICVAPGGASALQFSGLVSYLHPEQSFYVLQDPRLEGEHRPFASIPELAAFYIEEILTTLPEGPYYLGGACFGSVVALEMAQQLVRQKKEVAALIFIDGFWPEDVRERPALPIHLIQYITYHLTVLSMLPQREKLRHIRKKLIWSLRRIQTKLRIDGSSTNSDQLFAKASELIDESRRLRQSYRITPYPGKLTLVLPKRKTHWLTADTDHEDLVRAWEAYMTAGVDLYEFEGHHELMFQEPFIRFLAKEIQGCLDRATNQISGQISGPIDAGVP